MKKQKFTTLILIIALFPSSHLLRADVKKDLVDKYYRALQGMDGTESLMVWPELYKEVPPADRDELFAAILDRGITNPSNLTTNPSAAEWILDALASNKPWVWSVHLERSVLAYTKSKDIGIRGLLPEVLSKHDKEKYRDLCLSYLDDPDDNVRYRAVSAVENWPDAHDILSKYVREHQAIKPGNPGDSVERAKQLINN